MKLMYAHNDIPDGFNSITKVYVVNYDNGAEYEDNDHYIDNIFRTREEAKKYLADMGLIENEKEQTYSKNICSMNNINCFDCPKYWEHDMKCDEYKTRIENEHNHSFYTIEEYDLLSAYPMCIFDE